uniref:Lipocalin/cytosolic fatty-acid binding domain-containing protein n=1 Tax=Strombidium rassoulzadegani TaxID=1082188 RepID=A0A7S3FSK0_9SPIT|mmetsp:Transcript_13951/g.23729  ORF Transcript_13951/g.23729 Transcript_13951/m.23729 type:complete len:233 (+) Transcript_13951:42-740(+)
MTVLKTSKLWVILNAAGSFIKTEVDKLFDPEFVNMCDAVTVDPIQNFDANRYFGTWFEQAHVREFEVFQPTDSVCIQAEYTPNDDGTFRVDNTYQEDKNHWFSSTSYFTDRTGITGLAKCDEGVGSCYVSFFNKAFSDKPNYTVVDTDYDSYSIVYSCQPKTQKQIVWILSRTPELEEQTFKQTLSTIHQKIPNFDPSHFDGVTFQGSNCTYTSGASNNAMLNLDSESNFLF